MAHRCGGELQLLCNFSVGKALCKQAEQRFLMVGSCEITGVRGKKRSERAAVRGFYMTLYSGLCGVKAPAVGKDLAAWKGGVAEKAAIGVLLRQIGKAAGKFLRRAGFGIYH